MKTISHSASTIFHNHLSIEETTAGIIPLRFTSKQLITYAHSPIFGPRSLCPAGICIDVMTDAAQLRLEVEILMEVRPYCHFDLFINDQYISSIGDNDSPPQMSWYLFDLQNASKELQRITIYLPHNVYIIIREIVWSEGAKLEPITAPSQSLLCLGDSITQGMDAVYPSHTYPVQLSRRLGMNLLNQGVGGYQFDASSLDSDLHYAPNIITIAYGTNDWSKQESLTRFSELASEYMEKITGMYPSARIFVITPLWRVDWNEVKPMGTFHQMVETITDSCREYPTVRIIPGTELLAHDHNLLAGNVHPVDHAFQQMTDNMMRYL